MGEVTIASGLISTASGCFRSRMSRTVPLSVTSLGFKIDPQPGSSCRNFIAEDSLPLRTILNILALFISGRGRFRLRISDWRLGASKIKESSSRECHNANRRDRVCLSLFGFDFGGRCKINWQKMTAYFREHSFTEAN
ncbi:hypothetical protein GJ496_004436 [Pomphorhynchus laevis]|nr:hypothetical protein GJ496_004436 [Pomphorhynchus laevis]